MSGGGAKQNPLTTVALIGLAAAATVATAGAASPLLVAAAAGGVAAGVGADKLRNDALAARRGLTQMKASATDAAQSAERQISSQRSIENARAFSLASSRAASARAARGGGMRSLLSGPETGLRTTLG